MNELETKASFDQARASDPTVSAWVSANAGSGKTHVLVNRVIRLMLTGTPPEKILCLTYTKAAAAEMSNRLYERLAEWIPLDDDALIDKIHKNTGHGRFTTEELAVPRRLFARALETPGGLKIQTIHAFCVQLLHRFPLEAGVTSGFDVMDDRQAADLLARIRSDFFAGNDQGKDRQMQDHLAEVVTFASGQKSFNDLIENLLHKRDELALVYQDLDGASQRLAKALEIDPSDTVEAVIARASNGFDRPALIRAMDALSPRELVTDKDQADRLNAILTSDSDSVVFENLKSLTLKADQTQKSTTRLCTKKCGQDHPDILLTLQAEASRMEFLAGNMKAISVLHATNAALHIGRAITTRYAAEKDRLGFYDYHDQIAKVLSMFAQMPDAAWVLYKLDGGLDHILIDEAQDTSPAQWDIIQFLADDFFSGSGARPDVNRSIFAVGDRKQSIYSFQGAAPWSFDLRKRYFAQVVTHSGQKFEAVDFEVSFRSTSQVLATVDEVFAQVLANRGVDATVHSAQRKNAPGIVELWPLEERIEVEKTSIWMPDDDHNLDDHARIRLAKKIALKIRSWLDSREMLPSQNRPVQPGDILILVRRRTQMMAGLVRALKQLDIPVAGVDRLKLTEHIGVQDLMALARFVLLPQDDLNFAGLLKSSLLERNDHKPFDDDDLITIAADRGGSSVWASFVKIVTPASLYSNARQNLERWQDLSRNLLPFEFFTHVLSTDDKRKNLLKRLGTEANEPLDAFLNLAMSFEKTNVPTLQGFLSWMESGKTEIKREMEKNDNEVRVMTVHGAKGLESNIVILPDTFEVPDGKLIPDFLAVDDDTPVWCLKSDFSTGLTKGLKEQYLSESEEEFNRLLYVAMTRARDRLYIGAAEPKTAIKDHSWYQLASNILENPEYQTPDLIFGNVWRICQDGKDGNAPENPRDQTAKPSPLPLPDWALSGPPSQSLEARWVAPSKFGLDTPNQEVRYLSPLASLPENRFARGNLIHKMLQYLPDLAAEHQKDVAERYINAHGDMLTAQEQAATLDEILAILTDQKFAAVFAPGSMSEVPIVARIHSLDGKELVLNGQIDRLWVGDSDILIVDYKTNRPPPASIAAVNQQYIHQLAAYRLALLEIYPNHKFQAGLLWTHTATLMKIDENLLANVF